MITDQLISTIETLAGPELDANTRRVRSKLLLAGNAASGSCGFYSRFEADLPWPS